MRVAVIGAGVAGLVAAWLLAREHDTTLFEADGRLGGHVHTHEISLGGRRFALDTGFIVYNPVNYPLFARLLEELGVASQPTTMSFSVRNEASGLEYNAATLDALFCQRRNLLSPRFLAMVSDLLRFYRRAPALLELEGAGPTLGEYLEQERYGAAFRDEHLVPMASALWSAAPQRILALPAVFLARFMANHRMLQVRGRPGWRVIRGGSATYVQALRRRWRVRERPGCPVRTVERDGRGALVTSAAGRERFDHVVLACHSDQALALLADASEAERDILGAIAYQENEAVLHTDARLLPRRRKAWAAWNAFVPRVPGAACTVSYWMNRLQGLDAPVPFIVTLNRGAAIDPAAVLRRQRYHHPLYDHAAVAAQRRKPQIQGQRSTWFAGAYWGFGFHEDGVRSAVEVAAGLGVQWVARGPSAGDRYGRAA